MNKEQKNLVENAEYTTVPKTEKPKDNVKAATVLLGAVIALTIPLIIIFFKVIL